MTNSCFCSDESKETFTEHQIIEISAAITKAVEDAMTKQCSAVRSKSTEYGPSNSSVVREK